MAELTKEQKRAIAIATARKRMLDAQKAGGGAKDVPYQPNGNVDLLQVFNRQTGNLPAPPPVDPSQNPTNSVLPGFLGQASNTLRAGTQAGMDSALFNMGDEIAAGAQTLWNGATGQGWDYGKNLRQNEAMTGATEALNPTSAAVGGILGSFGSMGRAKGLIPRTPSTAVAPSPMRAAVLGGGAGAVSGFGMPGDIGQRLGNAAIGAGTGAMIGTVAGKLGQDFTVGQRPTIGALFDAGDKGFEATRATKAVVYSPAFKTFAQAARDYAEGEGVTVGGRFVSGVYTKLNTALRSIALFEKNGNISITQAITLRKALAKAAGSTDGNEAKVASDLLRQFDDFMVSLKAGQGSPNIGDVAKQWATARDYWHVASKANDIQKVEQGARLAAKAAGTSQTGRIRTDMANFVNAAEGRNLRGFSGPEQTAVKRIAEGTAVGNTGRFVGGLSANPANMFVSGAVPAAAGFFASGGSPVMAGAAAGAGVALGTAGKIVSRLSTNRQLELAQRLILAGAKGLPRAVVGASPEVKRAMQNLALIGGSNANRLYEEVAKSILPQASASTGQVAQ